MTLADLTSREAVLKAIDEFDEIGREAFLSRYGFKPSTGYVLEHNGRQYDSKAIVAAAHGFQHPNLGPLRWGDFSGGTPTTTKLEALGFELRSITTASPSRAGILIGSDDCALFNRYPRKVPFRDEFVPSEDKAAFKDLWARLKALAEWIAGHSSSAVVMKAEASHYAQNGYSQRDLWSCAFPLGAVNKSYGLQIGLIVSAQGAEVCFCLGAGKSQLSGQKRQEAEKALRALKGALSSVPESVVEKTENLLPSWQLRRRWRAQPGASDFSDLREWLSFASSPNGDGASISRYYAPEELDKLGERIGDMLLEAATLAAPLIEYCYLNSGELALLRVLSEYEAEADPDELERTRTAFALGRQRFEELFGSPERVDTLTAEQFFGFLNDIDSHVSPDTGLFTLGPGLPAPKNPELPTWTKLEEDLEKLQTCIKLLLFPRERSLSARIDAMLAAERPRRYITEELALPSILLCFVDPVHHAGVQRMPKKQQKLEAMGMAPDLSEPASLGEQFVAYEEALATLPQRLGRSWDWAMRFHFYWSDAFRRNLETLISDEEDEEVDTPKTADLSDLAASVYVPAPFLHEVLELLYEKGQIVFYGPPGTGKTYIAKKLIEHLALSSEEWDVVQFHPSYSYEDFVLGFRPFITTRGDLNYALQAGPLLRLAGHAQRYPSRKHFLLVDEINRGNLPRIFGELLYLMEDRGQRISLMYRPQPDTDGRQYALDQDGRFALPENLYIIGTMNTADRSIGLIDAALRRRFHFVPLFPGDWPLAGLLRRWLEDTQPPEMHQVADWVDRLNHKLEARFGRHLQVGHSYFMKASLSAGGVERIWKTDIMPFLEDQLFGRESELRHFALSALRNETPDIEESTEEAEVDGPGSDEQGLSDEDDLP